MINEFSILNNPSYIERTRRIKESFEERIGTIYFCENAEAKNISNQKKYEDTKEAASFNDNMERDENLMSHEDLLSVAKKAKEKYNKTVDSVYMAGNISKTKTKAQTVVNEEGEEFGNN